MTIRVYVLRCAWSQKVRVSCIMYTSDFRLGGTPPGVESIKILFGRREFVFNLFKDKNTKPKMTCSYRVSEIIEIYNSLDEFCIIYRSIYSKSSKYETIERFSIF